MTSLSTKWLRAAVLGGCLCAAAPSRALDVYLRADNFTRTMPDGKVIEMWGFALDNATWSAGTAPTSPGPRIDVPHTDSTLVIHLKNSLEVPISIVMPNQNGFVVDAPPTITPDDQGRLRARSFVKETQPGAIATYVWNNLTPGTYLYYSGSHPALQVQMGLYGALVRPASATQVYPGQNVQAEQLLVFSEIDSKVHEAVAANEYGPGLSMSSTIHSVPDYFLINGTAFTPEQAPLFGGYARESTLLRFLNASVNSHIPILNGVNQQIIAEDGRPYPYPKNLCAPELPALKTMDTVVTPTAAGTYALYDRGLGLVNGMESPGGMFTYLSFGQRFSLPVTWRVPGSDTGPGAANPSVSSRSVSGLAGKVDKVTFTLQGLAHPVPQDLDILLVSPAPGGGLPGNVKVLLMSDAGGTTAIPDTTAGRVTLTFEDAAPASLTTGRLVTGTYKPTNLPANGGDEAETFAQVTPIGGTLHTSLSALEGVNPNGTWRVYIRDDHSGSYGFIRGGWSLTLTLKP